MSIRKYVLLFLSIIFGQAYGQGTVQSAHVLYTGVYGSGRFFVVIDKTINEPGCENSRFDVDPSNSLINAWLSIAMASAVSGKTINVTTNGCYAGLPTLDNTTASYFYLNNN